MHVEKCDNIVSHFSSIIINLKIVEISLTYQTKSLLPVDRTQQSLR